MCVVLLFLEFPEVSWVSVCFPGFSIVCFEVACGFLEFPRFPEVFLNSRCLHGFPGALRGLRPKDGAKFILNLVRACPAAYICRISYSDSLVQITDRNCLWNLI